MNQPGEYLNRKNGEPRNSCRVKVEDVGVEGMMTLQKIGALVWDWRKWLHVELCRCYHQIWSLRCYRLLRLRSVKFGSFSSRLHDASTSCQKRKGEWACNRVQHLPAQRVRKTCRYEIVNQFWTQYMFSFVCFAYSQIHVLKCIADSVHLDFALWMVGRSQRGPIADGGPTCWRHDRADQSTLSTA